ncbi:undecaprenyl-diphosphate phosphatase [Oscillochloris sp. ZM17-4]|uniref:undecaprenyl-diphosphate phosphatase n=1 Tax=Oscillochloris sp. ZM17-4 TaxID=2866714 RepID=UPI001C73121E|nr:undecaprenyl-diphosphate phosphatase [Oscillochloris sp. ZM17-4]MBX0326432.1 undecaprenyl-diphosphate phosphatase [Oscillochloris sp. ZM17-4]
MPIQIGVLALLVVSLGITVPFDPSWWQVVTLGVVQGLTEFLPISSTAHLLIAADLIGFQNSIGGTFEIAIQFGTVIAVIAFYAQDLFGQANALIGRGTTGATAAARRLWLAVAVAFIPAAIIGLAFRQLIKLYLFDSPSVMATSLIVGGIIFLAIELLPHRPARTTELSEIGWKQALGVGVAQVFALIPGTSRSGSSIVGGMLAGLDRRTATAFSFYLSIPTLGAATLVDVLGSLGQIQPGDWGRLLLGAVVAMIVGWLSIGWLLRFVSRNNFVSFGIYRIIAGVVILALVMIGSL